MRRTRRGRMMCWGGGGIGCISPSLYCTTVAGLAWYSTGTFARMELLSPPNSFSWWTRERTLVMCLHCDH